MSEYTAKNNDNYITMKLYPSLIGSKLLLHFRYKTLKSLKQVKNMTLYIVPLNGFLEPAVTNSWLPYPQTALQPANLHNLSGIACNKCTRSTVMI